MTALFTSSLLLTSRWLLSTSLSSSYLGEGEVQV